MDLLTRMKCWTPQDPKNLIWTPTDAQDYHYQCVLSLRIGSQKTAVDFYNKFLSVQARVGCLSWEILGLFLSDRFGPKASQTIVEHLETGCLQCRQKTQFLTCCFSETEMNGETSLLIPRSLDRREYIPLPIITPEEVRREEYLRRIEC